MARMSEDEMLAALGVDTSPEPVREYSKQEERLLAGFEDIQRFVDEQGHAPRHGENHDIFERLYAARLDRLRRLPEAVTLLAPMDKQGLLTTSDNTPDTGDMDEDALLAALGADQANGDGDITVLRHVQSHAQRKAAEEVADRQACKDFERFEPLFGQARADLENDTRKTLRFGRDTSIEQGNFFILAGQMVYVAEVGETLRAPNGEKDARLRVIFANGTESDLLRRSLQRALYKDNTGRRVTNADTDTGPLFSSHTDENDIDSGTIYVLRSQSNEPFVVEHRELVHKIGVTGGKVETRIANAKHDPTYLLAEVDIVATYKLSNINRVKLESLLHRIFASAQLELTIKDRFGEPVKPREWFLVPLQVIDEAVNHIRDGSITKLIYDPATASLMSSGNH